jgi:hypothetical protein
MWCPTDFWKNCNLKFSKDYRFCSHCGQQAKDKLTVVHLFYNTVTYYFSFDARFLKVFIRFYESLAI